MPSVGADPITQRLRDALGAVRCLYTAAPDADAKAALKRAGTTIGGALSVAGNRRRDKELGQSLRAVQRDLDAAVRAAPWGAPVLVGAANMLRVVMGASVPSVEAPPALGMPPFEEG